MLVVTASERRLARMFLDQIGLGVELVASDLIFDPRPDLAVHNVGANKVAALRELGGDLASCRCTPTRPLI